MFVLSTSNLSAEASEIEGTFIGELAADWAIIRRISPLEVFLFKDRSSASSSTLARLDGVNTWRARDVMLRKTHERIKSVSNKRFERNRTAARL
jgi:hypothetical protein